MEQHTIDIDSILSVIAGNDAISDLHLSWEEPIAYRMNGEVYRQEQAGILSNEGMEIILKQLLHGNPEAYNKFLGEKDMDFAYMSKDWIPYRVNAFMKTGRIGIVMRKINAKAKDLDSLMFPEIAQSVKENILSKKKWLYLVTWPTGSWKSTSLVAMLEYLNWIRAEHMITIEDPIEFIFKPQKCLISQRELGNDTRSFANALKAGMREDPDIIFVGEIRDKETADAALSMAETGHLVFSTLHTSSAATTVNRYISFFPPEIQDSIADRLSDSLIGVQSQFLVKSTDGKSRMGIYEVMINTTSIRNNIKKKEIPQLDSIIETSSSKGMITIKQYAERLLNQWLIKTEDVQRIFGWQK